MVSNPPFTHLPYYIFLQAVGDLNKGCHVSTEKSFKTHVEEEERYELKRPTWC